MKINRKFCPGDCYVYDFGLCSYENRRAQVDTAQDASYFGTWAKPDPYDDFHLLRGRHDLERGRVTRCVCR